MTLSYKEWRDQIRAKIWPGVSGEARNLVEAHNEFFQDAMFDAVKYVTCLQENHTDVHPQCATYVDCAMTVIEAPPGKIKRVYTIANDDWCDKVFYDPVTIHELRCWAKHLETTFEAPLNENMPVLSGGMKVAGSSSDVVGGRMRTGIFALHNGRIYVAPWIQSNEKLVVEWDGRKEKWNDDDLVDTSERYFNRNVKKYIEHFVEHAHLERFEFDALRASRVKEQAEDALAESIHTCDRLQDLEPNRSCSTTGPSVPSLAEIEDDEVSAETDGITFAVIGDFGDPGNAPKPAEVAALVDGWNPNFIVTTGDNIYSPAITYAVALGSVYEGYVTDELGTNRFWPAIGNHDHNDPTNGIQDYFDYFTLPNNERYYDFVKGPVHFFVLHSGIQGNDQDNTEEADGIISTSKQGEWLRVRLALSTARWKVVVVHDAPYTSGAGNTPGFTYLRWPFAAWGADVVLSGDSHGYERLEVGGLPYIVNGAGGTAVEAFAAPIAGSEIIYGDDNGAMLCTADCDELEMKFYNTAGVLIDTLTLEYES